MHRPADEELVTSDERHGPLGQRIQPVDGLVTGEAAFTESSSTPMSVRIDQEMSRLFPSIRDRQMRLYAAIVVPMVLLGVTRGDDTPTKPITVAEAAKKVNEKVTVEMEVKSTGGKGICFLNSEADYKDANNFTILIPKETMAKFGKTKIDDPQKHFKGKTVLVTGTVTLYQKKPQIKVEDPDQIKVTEKK
jgi:hypothetical protein